jgi:murein DD-endopeptidase MepM/ murein hydrolase activator NlpD
MLSLVQQIASSIEPETPMPDPPDAIMSFDVESLEFAGLSGTMSLANDCGGESLGSPLDPPIASNSPFGPRSGVGASDFHYGTDYPVPTGTLVKAMASGTVATGDFGNTSWGKWVLNKT